MFRTIKALFRWIGIKLGLVAQSVDEAADALQSSPEGVKATFRQFRENWTKSFRDARDAIALLMVTTEQRKAELKKIDAEQAALELKKKSAVELFATSQNPKYQEAFAGYAKKLQDLQAREDVIVPELKDLEAKLADYKAKLGEMQRQLEGLDAKEAQAIADIVSAQQIVKLNDQLGAVNMSLDDTGLGVIEKARQKAVAKAKLSSEMSEASPGSVDAEIEKAARANEASNEFQQMLAQVKGAEQTSRIQQLDIIQEGQNQ